MFKRTKTIRAPCRKNPTKFSVKRTYRYCTIDLRVVVQWIPSYPCRNKTVTRHDEKFAAILTSRKQAWSDLFWYFLRFHKSLRRLGSESRQVDPTPIRNKWNRRRSGPIRIWCTIAKRKRWNVVVNETFKIYYQMWTLRTKEETTLFWVGQRYPCQLTMVHLNSVKNTTRSACWENSSVERNDWSRKKMEHSLLWSHQFTDLSNFG